MNPSGDFGKRELSPALRNRFTEIWCTAVTNRNCLSTVQGLEDFKTFTENIVKTFLPSDNWNQKFASHVSKLILDLFVFVNVENYELLRPLSLRDLKSMLEIIRCLDSDLGADSLYASFMLLFEANLGLSADSISRIKRAGFREGALNRFIESHELFPKSHSNFKTLILNITEDHIKINNLTLVRQNQTQPGATSVQSFKPANYVLDSQKVLSNLIRIIMGLKSGKALLLEGPPGVGKTSLVTQLAKLVNKKVYRVNLNEQTDLIDLLGQDVPDPKRPGSFKWAPGVLARSLENGDWLILDELNLASQTVLEGLNSVLDHRASVYVSELGVTLKKAPGFQIFGCQNAKSAGNRGRKGLPLSFLNRFVRIYLTDISSQDVINIISVLTKNLITEILENKAVFECQKMEIESGDLTTQDVNLFDPVVFLETQFEYFMKMILLQVDQKRIPAVIFNIRFFPDVFRFLSIFGRKSHSRIAKAFCGLRSQETSKCAFGTCLISSSSP